MVEFTVPEARDYDMELRKSSTLNSMYIGTTISKPNVDSIINAVATILQSQMLEVTHIINILGLGLKQTHLFRERAFLFFRGKIHLRKTWSIRPPKNRPPQGDADCRANFGLREGSIWLCIIFVSPILWPRRPECCIISLVYINRLIAFTELPLQPTNWRPLVLCSLLVAQKVWDDRYLSNADFAFIYPFFITEEINRLEKKFLELIQYNVTVKSNLYAKYYFELRALFKDNEKEFPLIPLDKRDAEKLEINSKIH